MLTKMEITNPRNATLALLLGGSGPNTEAIQVRNTEGLGPVKASISTSPFGSIDGEAYTGSSVGKRNIVITVGLDPNWIDQSMASLRTLLYAYFMPKQSVKLRFFSDSMTTVEISGYVEGFEPNIFAKDPEIQISIVCPLPDFVAIAATVKTGVVVANNVPQAGEDIGYLGNIATGFVLKVASSTALPSYLGSVDIVSRTPFSPAFSANSVTIDGGLYFEMSSVRGLKYARGINVLGGAIITLLRNLAASSTWPQLEPGVNNFYVAAATAGQVWTLTYFNRFGGL